MPAAHRWECYFEPLSPCSELDAWQPYTVEPREAYFSDYNGYFYNADTQVGVGGMHAAARLRARVRRLISRVRFLGQIGRAHV